MSCIVLGITGSIAAYKAAGVASRLVKLGHEVHCVCTPAALHFVTPLTLQTLSRNPVICSFEDETQSWVPVHIELAQKADLLAIVPATANTIACMAQGLAPNALTSLYLANRAPVLIFPAMNGNMWDHPATQANVRTLAERGHRIIGPEECGTLACGAEGKGRLVSEETIVNEIVGNL
ncbi:MAG: phosphopantothenoylcysteine decarboxylase [Akkermansia sp.]|nr:phosphopantothenoylcysteine decarboxylase [Akkermansia sp.]